MKLFKVGVKIVLLPVILAMTLLQWIGIIVTSCSRMFMNLISGLLFTVAVIGYLVNPGIRWHAVNIMVLAFAVFILPHLAKWMIYRITDLNLSMRKFIRS